MPTNTYVALQTTTLTSVAQGITFTNIPQGYTDLVLVLSLISKTAGNDIRFRVGNNSIDTGANYSATFITGNGSTANSDRVSNQTYVPQMRLVATTTNPATFIFNFQNYSNTTTFKTIISRNSSPSSEVGASTGLWRSTSAINQIYVYEDGNVSPQQFDIGTTATIYGIAAASVGAKATGGTIYTDSQYFYHVFAGNGTFAPTQSISADVLMVAGGGGGGSGNVGGGGGAGGLLNLASQSLTATNYTVTVGGGGAGRVGDGNATNGVNSSFGGLTAAVGGGAGTSGASFVNGVAGGSGGGAWTFGGIGGAGTSGQGFAGGNGSAAVSPFPSGGGGGAGAAGTSATSTASGPGGIGSSTYNSWGAATGIGQNVSGTYYLAGGGGGGASTQGATLGAGGLGGGGAGGGSGAGVNGLTNTGGGAGGGGNSASFSGGTGGSGVVIVRYAK